MLRMIGLRVTGHQGLSAWTACLLRSDLHAWARACACTKDNCHWLQSVPRNKGFS